MVYEGIRKAHKFVDELGLEGEIRQLVLAEYIKGYRDGVREGRRRAKKIWVYKVEA